MSRRNNRNDDARVKGLNENDKIHANEANGKTHKRSLKTAKESVEPRAVKQKKQDKKECSKKNDELQENLSKKVASVKRKIDFSAEATGSELEHTNNSNVSVGKELDLDLNLSQDGKMNLRERTAKGSLADCWVQWTKEFMEKVKRSNEKARLKQKESVNDKPGKGKNQIMVTQKKTSNQISNILQDGVVAGDGIEVCPDNEDDIEILDYDDDLSIDGGDDEPLPRQEQAAGKMSIEKTAPVIQAPMPGTSGVGKVTDMVSLLENVNELDEERLLNNPVMQCMMTKFFNNSFKDLGDKGMNENVRQLNNCHIHDEVENFSQEGINKMGQQGKHIKSPSDTKIYAPALQKKLTPVNNGNNMVLNYVTENADNAQTRTDFNGAIVDQSNVQGVMLARNANEKQSMFRAGGLSQTEFNQISNCVETVRAESHPDDLQQQTQQQTKDRRLTANKDKEELEQACIRADRAVLEAEKFQVQIEQPGMNTIFNIGSGVSDDDFFHLTCHIEPNLIHKIKQGEFIELEKLLPKDKLARNSDENRLEWVQQDGGTFLVPAQKDGKINSFRRWEQAFRAYATIYCGANPHRAKEIWQYITVINTAASAYLWDNVYNYDITFRHLMAFNPHRSWAVTYNQMWNLSMRDPLPKNNHRGAVLPHYSGGGFVNNKPSAGNMQVSRNKSNYCWNFNKGVPCKFGPRCKFIERCKYCDSPSHGVNACTKLQRKDKNSTANSAQANANEKSQAS